MTPRHAYAATQRGIVLIITLVSLVILLLAATALFRSVDTATLIAGNLALRQAAVASSDGAVSDAVNAINLLAANSADPWQVPAHPLNNNAAPYYTWVDPSVVLTASSTWVDGVSSPLSAADRSGNQSRYIIQRMCRTANQVPTITDCLLNYTDKNNNSKKIGPPPPKVNQTSMVFRITVRTVGPKNTVSYTQAFVN